MIQVATDETNKAERLVKALYNHFARKSPVNCDENKDFIDFGDGRCEITATSNTVGPQAETETVDGLEHVKRAVGKHLHHFTPDDDIQINWSTPS